MNISLKHKGKDFRISFLSIILNIFRANQIILNELMTVSQKLIFRLVVQINVKERSSFATLIRLIHYNNFDNIYVYIEGIQIPLEM